MSRKTAYRLGLHAEKVCAMWLRLAGYRILEMRYKTHIGEIDIIARRGRCLVFIEVKARRDQRHIHDSVSLKNRQRITRAAQAYITQNPALQNYDMRFDIMLVGSGFWPDHKKNAWRLDELGISV